MQAHVHDASQASGTLGGHALPGAMFILWALIWMAQTARARSDATARRTLETSLYVPVLKIALPLVGAWIEIPGRGWYPMDVMMGWHHVNMYAVFSLSGVIDLLARRGRLGTGAGHFAYAAASLNAGFLFLVHGEHGGVAGAVHALLAGLFATAALAALVEWWRPSPGGTWTRIGALLAVGSWFMTGGWILYLSGWDLADPIREGWAYLVFSWMLVVVAVLTLGVRLSTGWRRTRPAL